MVLTKDSCLKYLNQSVKKHQLEKFFTTSQLDQIATTAVGKLDAWREQAKQYFSAKEMEEYAYSFLLLSLYQIHILLDDTGSMYEGTRIDTAHATVRGIINIDSTILEKGVYLHLINETDPTTTISSGNDFENLWKNVSFGGPTRLGTVLKQKVWSKIVNNSSQFTRPCLVYIITDGEPTAEPRTALKQSILDCKTALSQKNYSPASIAFGLVQVGDDQDARAFLGDLIKTPELRDHVDVVNEDDVLENKYRASQNRPEEIASTLFLELLVGAIENVGGSYD